MEKLVFFQVVGKKKNTCVVKKISLFHRGLAHSQGLERVVSALAQLNYRRFRRAAEAEGHPVTHPG